MDICSCMMSLNYAKILEYENQVCVCERERASERECDGRELRVAFNFLY